MTFLKGLQKTALFSTTVAVLAFGGISAKAAPFNTDTVAGTCTGAAAGNDCGTATGHIGVSVVGTLSINEKRAINFGNVAVTTGGAADGVVTLTPQGALTGLTAGTAGLVLLSGANANGGTGGGQAGVAGNDGQQAGQYEIKGANEGGQTRVYITFSSLTNQPIDANGDTFYPTNNVTVTGNTGETFMVDTFTFIAPAAGTLGKDVYGNYVSGAGAGPWNIAVGAKLHTVAATASYPAGKYVGEFNITAAY